MRHCREIGLGAGIEMRAADHDHRLGRARPGMDRGRRALVAERHALRALPDDATPNQIRGWRSDNAEYRNACRDQRDIDGELVTSGNKFAGAVKRIDQEINLTLKAGVSPRLLGPSLLGNDWNVGRKPFEILQDDRFRRMIG